MPYLNHKVRINVIIIILATVLLSTCYASDISIYTKPGNYLSPSKQCIANLQVSQQGGFIELTIFTEINISHKLINVSDITGIAWLDNNKLIFSVSPLYGKPGIYFFNCLNEKDKPIRIVAPVTYNKYYPDGADYFELHSIEGKSLCYYYGRDVDDIDFKVFRINSNLLTHVIDQPRGE